MGKSVSKPTGAKKLTQAEKARLLDEMIKGGIISASVLQGGIVGKKEPETLAMFKDTKGNSIEISTWYDKEGKEYVSQTKILPTGTRTKGFAVEMQDFKKYVSTLNSVADKLNK